MAVFAPSVGGLTGIPSTDAIRAIVGAVNPDHVLIVDSLCCRDKERLGNNFQITSTGITPGSGIHRDNARLDEAFLGVPTTAIGVPLVIHLPELHYVVPKAIDALVAATAKQIAMAVQEVVE